MVPETLELSLIIAEAVLRRLEVPEDVVEDAAELVRRYHTRATRLSRGPRACRLPRSTAGPYLSLRSGWSSVDDAVVPELAAPTGRDGAIALGGCVDMFTSKQPADADAWRGTDDRGKSGVPGVRSVRTSSSASISGPTLHVADGQRPGLAVRVHRIPTVRSMADGITTWWLEGYVTSANFVEFETRLQQPILPDLRPYSVWRGTRNAERMTLVEFGSPCDREVVLTRG